MVVHERNAAAKLLGISPRALGDWKKEEGFPDTAAGYDIDAINAWRQARLRKGSESGQKMSDVNLALKLLRAENFQKKNRREQIEIEKEEGSLLPRRLYELFISNLLSGIGDWCEQLPTLIEAELPKKYAVKTRKRIEEELRRMRNQLAEDLKHTPSEMRSS